MMLMMLALAVSVAFVVVVCCSLLFLIAADLRNYSPHGFQCSLPRKRLESMRITRRVAKGRWLEHLRTSGLPPVWLVGQIGCDVTGYPK